MSEPATQRPQKGWIRAAQTHAPRYSCPPFLLHGRRTDKPLSSSAPTPGCTSNGDIAPSFWSPLPPTAAGSSVQRSYAVPFRDKSPTSPSFLDELISTPRRFLAFTYKKKQKGREVWIRRTKGRERKQRDVQYLGLGLTRARRHRPLSPRHSQSRQSRPIRLH